MPIPTTYPPRIPPTGKRTGRLFKAAGAAKPQMAVYDANGVLQGTIDPENLVELAQLPGKSGQPSNAEVAANAARVVANAAPASQQEAAAAEVAKSVGPILGTMKPRPAGQVRKATLNLNTQWADLVKSVPSSTGAALQSAVAQAALALMMSGRADGAKAVTMVKRATVEAAMRRNLF